MSATAIHVRKDSNRSNHNVHKYKNAVDELQALCELHKPNIRLTTVVKPKNQKIKKQCYIEKYTSTVQTTGVIQTLKRILCKREVYVNTRNSQDVLPSSIANGDKEEESVWCEMQLHNDDMLLTGCVVHSPNSNNDKNARTNRLIQEVPTNKKYSHILIGGDCNYHGTDWQK